MTQADWCDREGATKLAQRIREYWARRGYTIDVRLQEEAFNMRMRSGSWNVRSNMIDGRPRNKTQ